MPYFLALNGGNGKAANAESESINDRPKRSTVGRRVTVTGKNREADAARKLRKT